MNLSRELYNLCTKWKFIINRKIYSVLWKVKFDKKKIKTKILINLFLGRVQDKYDNLLFLSSYFKIKTKSKPNWRLIQIEAKKCWFFQSNKTQKIIFSMAVKL
jgi:hypothetical protein